jgi:hypothetical protein
MFCRFPVQFRGSVRGPENTKPDGSWLVFLQPFSKRIGPSASITKPSSPFVTKRPSSPFLPTTEATRSGSYVEVIFFSENEQIKNSEDE